MALIKVLTVVIVLKSWLVIATDNFDIVPTNMTQAEGLNATFRCLHSTPLSYFWEVDGSSIDSVLLSNVSSGTIPADDGVRPIQTLTITALPMYNGTTVVCVVVTPKREFEMTENATLTVQGVLSAVGDLRIISSSTTTLSLAWEAPFSLIESGTTYCVKVNSIFDGFLALDECGVTTTVYNISLANMTDRTCDNFNITVTPVNGAGNGTVNGVSFETLDNFSISGANLIGTQCVEDPMTRCCEVVLAVHIVGSVSTCDCRVEINGRIFNESNGLVCESSTLTLNTNTSQLPLANFYNVTITLSNSVGSISATMEIDTNAISTVQVNSSTNAVHLSASFANDNCINSTDVLIVLAPLSAVNNTIATNQTIRSLVRSIGTDPASIDNVLPGRYTVLVYDLGSNGLPRTTPTVTPLAREEVAVTGSIVNAPTMSSGVLSLSIEENSNILAITCNAQPDGCLVVIQFIGTLDEFEHLNIYKVDADNQLGITLPKPGDYLVTGYPVTERGIIGSLISQSETISVQFSPPTTLPPITISSSDSTDDTSFSVTTGILVPTIPPGHSPTNAIIVSIVVVASLLLLIVAVVIVILLVYCMKKHGGESGSIKFNPSRDFELSTRPLVHSPDQQHPVSDGDGGHQIEVAPPSYNEVMVDPMYDSVKSPPSSKANGGHGVTPEDVQVDPNYDSVGPAPPSNRRKSSSTRPPPPPPPSAVNRAALEPSPSPTPGEAIDHTPGPATREPYAMVNMSQKTRQHEATPEDGGARTIDHQPGPSTGEPYAVVDKSKKLITSTNPPESGEERGKSPDHQPGPLTGEMYAVVDKPKKTSTAKQPSHQPPLPDDTSPSERHHEESKDHVYDTLVDTSKMKQNSPPSNEPSSLEPHEGSPRKSNKPEYTDIELAPLEDIPPPLPGQPDDVAMETTPANTSNQDDSNQDHSEELTPSPLNSPPTENNDRLLTHSDTHTPVAMETESNTRTTEDSNAMYTLV